MDLLIVSGFLGAGKTSVLLPLARFLCEERGVRLAIIENEIGEVGIDDVLLRKAKLPVRELYSGCICCSLRIDLAVTLLEIETTYAPELVIVEPSGVAGPRQVVEAMRGYGGELERILVVTLLDAERLPKLQSIQLPFITNGIEAADLLVLNKIDAVDAEVQATLTREILELCPTANLLPVSTATGENIDALYDWLLDALDKPPVDPQEAHPAPHACEGDSRPTGAVVFSHKNRLCPADSPETLTTQLYETMEQFLVEIREAGCTMIGHVKAIAAGPGTGYVLLSATEFSAPLSVSGELTTLSPRMDFTLNAIVFGLDRAKLAEIATRNFAPLFNE